MDKRVAHIGKTRINSIAYSSMFEIGDANTFTPTSRVIAVQKEGGVETDEGFEFDQYELFSQEPSNVPDSLTVQQKNYHHNPNIHVENIDVKGISASSIAQLGSLNHIDSVSRIKHIRILEKEQNQNDLIE
ncbi:spore germination protein GerPE [Aquibacillus halophilus]|uniref:Spore germination protein GerPE n=1 Tax=Aquibacillus halophilus TaxID=930132 RepID=A0A6A8DEW1_9BACI|nr:spore germination protein GerPE [Aquibacillus halophilus]MRH44183.1 spore germination protein GerPE [Aquibacillus halophilus]